MTTTRSPKKKPVARSKAPRPAVRPTPGQRAPAAAANRLPRSESVDPAPQPAPRRPAYYEAIALYESGVRALQKHDFQHAADHFRAVLDRYPEERELHERARLYLRVCERETARQPAGPQTPQERVYAATVSLNAGDHAGALDHLRRALEEAPEDDHAHYIMAVALTQHGEPAQAIDHLRRAVTLNPENRSLARHDPDLEALREQDGFKDLIENPARRRARLHR